MSYDHKITDLKFHLKGLINQEVCADLINFFEDKKHMAIPESSYKFYEDEKANDKKEDNSHFLNISQLRNEKDFEEPYEIILKYIRIVLTNHEIYVRNNFCPNYQNIHMTHTKNIRILKYDVGHCIKDHTDVSGSTRGSLTINLNEDYEGGEFRFFGGRVKLSLSRGEAMLFPGEPIWIHGTEPITKGTRYAINCFLQQGE